MDSSNLEELKNLAEAAEYKVVHAIEQIRERDSSYQIGRGKAKELAKLVIDLNADKIIFENDLTSTQSYNIAKLTKVEAIDRFQLILEIFSKRASTREAKLQIKLANLHRQLPRAKESVRLARQGEQPGFRGLGRYEVEVHYEAIKRQMAHVRRKLERVREKRKIHRRHRLELGFSLVSLAGYTNSGKSTLFKALAEEPVPINRSLFTTLSTKTRAINLKKRKVLLTDTVGFIDHLPLALIESFHSTLEETMVSDVIILLLDANEPIHEIKRKLSVCLKTIKELDAGSVPIITALNKIDLLTQTELNKKTSQIKKEATNLIPISASKKINLDKLIKTVNNHLEPLIEATFIVPLSEETMALISRLFDQDNVIEVKYDKKTANLRVNGKAWVVNRIKSQIEKLNGKITEFSILEKEL